ncbi:MAG: hypothetical protein IPG74_14185 [Flavobacteriales bacterium]|mgnify:CR=1 FL=1|nr:hypothetical protein [Flavobacteriales bacterium]MBK7554459.1 hypothetical protein [Flavobacteriales bacterium]
MPEALATITLAEEGLIELRYRPDAKLTIAGMRDLLQSRIMLCGAVPHKVLSFLPDGIDFDKALMDQDLYGDPVSVATTRAMAIVVTDPVNSHMLELFFAYYPAQFPMRLFSLEVEARKWLKGV